MTQETRVYEVSAAQAEALERSLVEKLPPAKTEWRTAPHARFSVKADGVVLTCYHSGKVVLQGRDLDAFAARFLSLEPPSARPELRLDAPTAGSDEAGKGDYFGPLVVAAVFVAPSDADRLTRIGVVDSKTLSDDRARLLAGAIERAFDCEVVTLDPPEYNRRHAEVGNLNHLLADLHARALAALRERHPEAEVAVVDRFANERLVAGALRRVGAEFARLVQIPRGERHPAVAAASIVARARFLDGLAQCSDEVGTDLHKGAGAPVDVCARRVARIGGRELLARIAKLHFKNTRKIPGLA